MIQDKFTQVSNPFVAEYLGSEFHDYFTFQSEDGTVFDFANQTTLGDSHFQRPMDNGKEAWSALGGEEVFGMGVSTFPHPLLRGTNNMYPAMLPNQKHQVVGGFVNAGEMNLIKARLWTT